MLNAARAFRDMSDVPSTPVPSTFESEAAARAAMVDATLVEAHAAFQHEMAPPACPEQLALHALDLDRAAPAAIVAQVTVEQAKLFRCAADPAPELATPRKVRRKGCLRAVASAGKLEEQRADKARRRQTEPRKPRQPRKPKPAPPDEPDEPDHQPDEPDEPSEPDHQPDQPAEPAEPDKPDKPAERDQDKASEGSEGSEGSEPSEPSEPGEPGNPSNPGSEAPRPAPRKRKAAAGAEFTDVAPAELLAAGRHALYPNPAHYVSQLRAIEGGEAPLRAGLAGALLRGAPSPELELVCGCPGAGKSAALLELAAEAARDPAARLLVAAPTNLMTEALHRRLAALLPDPAPVLVMRAGRQTGEAEAVDPESEAAATARVVVATTATATLACLRRGEPVTHLFVDEAGLVHEAATWALLSWGEHTRRLTLAGDPCQLESLVSEEGKALGLGRSAFSRLLGLGYPCRRLSVQRRMHPAIAAVLPRFYDYPISTEYAPPADVPPAVLGVRAEWGEAGGEELRGTSVANPGEARRAAAAAGELRRRLPAGHTVAVLAPYRAQLEELRAATAGLPGVEVATVDSFQGREASGVVLSLTRDGRAGFWADDARLCVALTRARHALVLLGGPGWRAELPHAPDAG
jgi:hypothetical protein